MEIVPKDKENADVARRFLTLILMDLVEHDLLTLDEAERARRVYLEKKNNKERSGSKGYDAKQD